MATEREGPQGIYTEPAEDLAMTPFLAALAGHAMAIHASAK